MPFDWRAYLHLARELIDSSSIASDAEARLRTAVSRSYYSIYAPARESFFRRHSITHPPGPQTKHRWLIDSYKDSTLNRTEKRIGKGMERLWELRLRADYETNGQIEEPDANLAHGLAVRIFNQLASF